MTAAHAAFTTAMATGFSVAGTIVVLGALGLAVGLPRRVSASKPSQPPTASPRPAPLAATTLA